ncbi:hypothetical protein KAH81_05760 [bacterium]|nr:hypothetical protein [bacterium]
MAVFLPLPVIVAVTSVIVLYNGVGNACNEARNAVFGDGNGVNAIGNGVFGHILYNSVQMSLHFR